MNNLFAVVVITILLITTAAYLLALRKHILGRAKYGTFEEYTSGVFKYVLGGVALLAIWIGFSIPFLKYVANV